MAFLVFCNTYPAKAVLLAGASPSGGFTPTALG